MDRKHQLKLRQSLKQARKGDDGKQEDKVHELADEGDAPRRGRGCGRGGRAGGRGRGRSGRGGRGRGRGSGDTVDGGHDHASESFEWTDDEWDEWLAWRGFKSYEEWCEHRRGQAEAEGEASETGADEDANVDGELDEEKLSKKAGRPKAKGKAKAKAKAKNKGKAKDKTKKTKNAESEEAPEEEPEEDTDGPTTFARRYQPTREFPKARWTALRSSFNRLVKPKKDPPGIHEVGESSYKNSRLHSLCSEFLCPATRLSMNI